MKQAARNLAIKGCATFGRFWYLIRDRDAKITFGIDIIFKSVSIDAVKLPARSPNLKLLGERFMLSIESECLDRETSFGEASLRQSVEQYLRHHRKDRSNQGIGNVVPSPIEQATDHARDGPTVCDERLGVFLRSYLRKQAA
jgi:hypothetical protein